MSDEALRKVKHAGMDKCNSWKKTEDIEIDLADLLQRLCGEWKRIAVCALVSAVIFGGYRWMKSREGPAQSGSGAAEETVLSESEEQAVADAVRLESEIRGLETYLDNSVLMQLDPYHKNKFVMLYCIDNAERKELPKITESYLNFIINGGAADILKESGSVKLEKSCLAELISAYQKTNSAPYQVIMDSATDSSQMTESLFYVEITGENAKQAERMALALQDVLDEYSGKVVKQAGRHRLMLVSTAESVTADSGLQTQQHDKKALLSANRTNLNSMKDSFSKEQMDVYKKEAGLEEEQEESETIVFADNITDEQSGSVLKYVLLGFSGCIFVYCVIFSCCYILNDEIKSTDEMKRLYEFPVYGGIFLKDRDRKTGRASPDDFGCAKEHVLNRIRLACQKQGITKLCAASDFPLDVLEKECLENMAVQLKEWGISLILAESFSEDTAVWDSLAETGNVLMVCRIGTTTHRMIEDAMDFYLENRIAVAGAAVFLQNRTCL